MQESESRKLHSLSQEEKRRIRVRLSELMIARREVLFSYIHGPFINEDVFQEIQVAVRTDVSNDPLQIESYLSNELTEAVGIPVEVRARSS